MLHLKNKAEFDQTVNGDKLVIVDFFATWCGPCRVIAPEFEKLSKEHPEIVFAKVDVDEAEDIAAAVGVTAMPTFMAFRKGNKVGEVIGANLAGIKALTSK